MLIDYLATHPDAVLWFFKSDMQPQTEVDMMYLVLRKVCSGVATNFYSWHHPNIQHKNSKFNGTVYVFYKTIPNEVSSASLSETVEIYIGVKEAVVIS